MILSFGGTPSCSVVNISIPLSGAPEVYRTYLAVVKDEAAADLSGGKASEASLTP